jgi:hypothetical protein
MMKNYGVKSAMQNPKLAQQQFESSIQAKKFILQDGQEVYLRGYEKQAFDHLVKFTKLSNIKLKLCDMPQRSFKYQNERIYYPDMYLADSKTFVEVKSLYTVTRPSLQDKGLAVIANGYKFRLMILNEDDLLFDQTFSKQEEFRLSDILIKFNLIYQQDQIYRVDWAEVEKRLLLRLAKQDLCDYGCGRTAKVVTNWKLEKICCESSSGKCPGLSKQRWINRKRVLETSEHFESRFEANCLCDYGCGFQAKFRLKVHNGYKACCEQVSGKCPAVINRRWANRRSNALPHN